MAYRYNYKSFDLQSIVTTLTSHSWDSMVEVLDKEIKRAFALKFPVDNDLETLNAMKHNTNYHDTLVDLQRLILFPNTLQSFIETREIQPNLMTLMPVIETLVNQGRLAASVLDKISKD